MALESSPFPQRRPLKNGYFTVAAAISFIVILAISFLMVKIATVALVHTGVSQSLARFQARSAFTGTGFTTSEAEKAVNHPVRRRIIGFLMIVRSAGLVTGVSSLILSFVNVSDRNEGLERAGLLLAGVIGLWLVARSKWFDDLLSRIINWALRRWTRLASYDFEELLNLSGDYRVYEIEIEDKDWLAGKTLDELDLPEEGVNVLGVHRPDGRYIGAPDGATKIKSGDRVVLYGKKTRLRELDTRVSGAEGDKARSDAEAEHKRERQAAPH